MRRAALFRSFRVAVCPYEKSSLTNCFQIGMVGPTTTFLGGDSAVHLSEELKDASYVLPRAMASAAVVNYVLGFVTTVTLMFNLGNVADDLADPSGQPWVAIIYRITGSKGATIALLIVMIIMVSAQLSRVRLTGTILTSWSVLLLCCQSGHHIFASGLCIRARQRTTFPPLPLQSPTAFWCSCKFSLFDTCLYVLVSAHSDWGTY